LASEFKSIVNTTIPRLKFPFQGLYISGNCHSKKNLEELIIKYKKYVAICQLMLELLGLSHTTQPYHPTTLSTHHQTPPQTLIITSERNFYHKQEMDIDWELAVTDWKHQTSVKSGFWYTAPVSFNFKHTVQESKF